MSLHVFRSPGYGGVDNGLVESLDEVEVMEFGFGNEMAMAAFDGGFVVTGDGNGSRSDVEQGAYLIDQDHSTI